MRVIRVTAEDMNRAMRKVRQTLGDDAIILATGKLPDGGVEITAAIDPPADKTEPAPAPELAAGAGLSGSGLDDLTRKVESLSQMLGRHIITAEAAGKFAARPELLPIYNHFKRQEVDPPIIAQLLDGLSSSGGRGLLPRLAIRLKKMLKVSPGLHYGQQRPNIWTLVGPTGVGKTTTVAKLAALCALKLGMKVGLVTLDTFRIAATEQIKVYGRIMDLPTCVASNAGEFSEVLNNLREQDIILVDTVGRSPKDQDNMADLEAILAGGARATCHLVMACPTRDKDQQEVMRSFGRFKPKTLIYTKLDETSVFGPILNQVVKSGLPVSYVTLGQKVPDDLEEANREMLVKRLMPPREEEQEYL
jgi:flagellar biosynthesis protein FlhF